MAGASASTPWGNIASKAQDPNKGFFNLDSEVPSPSKSRSFKKVLYGTSSGDILPLLTQSTYNGVPAVMISEDEILKLASPFHFTLVGKFGLQRPNLDAIHLFFWNLKLSYFILNCQIRILKWTPFFNVKEESPIMPIWILFPNLRLHFFNTKFLHTLGSIFGLRLQTDQVTASRTRPSVATVLVEVDITKKHAKEVWVGSKAFGYLQKVEFGKVPDFCNHCKAHNHALSKCFKLHPELKKISSNSNGMRGNSVTSNENMNIIPSGSQDEIHSNVEKARNLPINASDSLVVLDKSLSSSPMKELTNKKPIQESEKSLNIFIFVDSMLHNEENPNDLLKLVTLDKGKDYVEECEEGEYNPSKTLTEVVDNRDDKGNGDCHIIDSSSTYLDFDAKNTEEEGSPKMQKKKKKNVKASIPDTPHSTRAQDNPKNSND
ncbi:hypothetical protein KFK09_001906 [Dendrobium nobile]|uniref:DUF4283 domain-containing protein n=1 Tax=Dendrobium nobile TaxID=94219 RepID=A0A8T3C8T5_DENNO|nr:hypothetical protein KFK09_001906 [Dendrobium nobile]